MSGKSKSAKTKWRRTKLLAIAAMLEREGKEYVEDGAQSALDTEKVFFGRRAQRLMGAAQFLRSIA